VSRRRGLIVGVQAAAVTLLVLLVYSTLLRPNDPDGLHPIEAPGVGAQTNNNRPGNSGNSDQGGGGDQRPSGPGGPAGPGSPAGGGGTTRTPAAVLAGTGEPTPGTSWTTPVDRGTPSDDQYADAVGSLLRKVSTGGAIGE
jgi:hypothetical protein